MATFNVSSTHNVNNVRGEKKNANTEQRMGRATWAAAIFVVGRQEGGSYSFGVVITSLCQFSSE